MSQRVVIFRFGARMSINPSHLTTLNVWMGVDPYEALESGLAPQVIGEVALRLLDLSCQRIPHPPDLHKRTMSAGFFAALALEPGKLPKGLRSCSVTREVGVLKFTPTRHKGGGSFVGIGDAQFTLDTQDPQAVGEAVLRCLDACR